MDAKFKRPTVDMIDPIISAEIPNKNEDPELYQLVKEFMMHGPCGAENYKSPCMIDNKCSKKFPKDFQNYTIVDGYGYPLYRRRDNGNYVEKSGVKLDNRSVVPYNSFLLKRYQAHINVEWCNQGSSIKYLFKYINKGPDRATISLIQGDNSDNNEPEVDEIKEYYDCRYISACEAACRIFSFDVHYRYPSVIRLPFYLENQQNVTFGETDDIDDVLNKESVSSLMFSSWMEYNKNCSFARSLTYIEFPQHFVWKNTKPKGWYRRKQGTSIGRIHSVSPKVGEAYFLRILLNKVKGPTCFEDLRSVDGKVFPTFRDACYARGLLDDDKEYIAAIEEAHLSGNGYQLRFLFAWLLMSNSLSRPDHVWNNTWHLLADGIQYNNSEENKTTW